MSTPITLGLGVSASASQSVNPDQGFQGATYINFGSGLIESPGNIDPQTSASPVANSSASPNLGTETTPLAAAVGGSSNLLLYAALAIGGLSLIATLYIILEHKK